MRLSLSHIITLSALLTLTACGGVATNTSLNSIHQPVIEHQVIETELATGGRGLAYGEKERFGQWLDSNKAGYGDRVILNTTDPDARAAAVKIAEARGITVEDGDIDNMMPGETRVTLVRAGATVPGCPDWSARSDFNPLNATSSNYGCAVNSNLAAMVADSNHLLHGAKSEGEAYTDVTTKAVKTWREAEPTGAKGLSKSTTTGGAN